MSSEEDLVQVSPANLDTIRSVFADIFTESNMYPMTPKLYAIYTRRGDVAGGLAENFVAWLNRYTRHLGGGADSSAEAMLEATRVLQVVSDAINEWDSQFAGMMSGDIRSSHVHDKEAFLGMLHASGESVDIAMDLILDTTGFNSVIDKYLKANNWHYRPQGYLFVSLCARLAYRKAVMLTALCNYRDHEEASPFYNCTAAYEAEHGDAVTSRLLKDIGCNFSRERMLLFDKQHRKMQTTKAG